MIDEEWSDFETSFVPTEDENSNEEIYNPMEFSSTYLYEERLHDTRKLLEELCA